MTPDLDLYLDLPEAACAGPVRGPLRPHDLVWLGAHAVLGTAVRATAPDAGLAQWASGAWLQRAPAVVRRGRAEPSGWVPLGLRGRLRNQRQAIVVRPDGIESCLPPESVSRGWMDGSMTRPPWSSLACLQALGAATSSLQACGLPWGPTGGVGFALASGLAVLHDHSDLDLLVRVQQPAQASTLRALGAELQAVERSTGCRIDVQVQLPTSRGLAGFALKEWLRTEGPVLLRLPDGPVLVDSPWREPPAPGPFGTASAQDLA